MKNFGNRKNAIAGFTLPIHNATVAGKLRTLVGVLLKFQIRSIGVLAPALPCLVAAQFLGRHLHPAPDQRFAHRVDVLHFQTKMMDALTTNFRLGIGFENLDEMTGAELKIKPEQDTILEKVKMPF
jgi:hypothetical protein